MCARAAYVASTCAVKAARGRPQFNWLRGFDFFEAERARACLGVTIYAYVRTCVRAWLWCMWCVLHVYLARTRLLARVATAVDLVFFDDGGLGGG